MDLNFGEFSLILSPGSKFFHHHRLICLFKQLVKLCQLFEWAAISPLNHSMNHLDDESLYRYLRLWLIGITSASFLGSTTIPNSVSTPAALLFPTNSKSQFIYFISAKCIRSQTLLPKMTLHNKTPFTVYEQNKLQLKSCFLFSLISKHSLYIFRSYI